MTARIAGSTADAPAPAGPYSQSARIGEVVAAAGQGGFTPDGVLLDGVPAQTEQALRNVAASLRAAGADLGDVIHVRVYLTETSHFAEMNAVYESFFDAPYPARTTVFVTLAADLLVEIDAIAVVSGDAQ